MEKFKQLGLSEGILNAIRQAGFNEPSEIQVKTIPLVIDGRDVIGCSATGSGKTLAFGAGIIDKVVRGYGIQSLILTPTRELAEQVCVTLKKFSRHKGLNIKEIYGGVSMEGQIKDLRTSDIVVGTPGRLLDHLNRKTLNLSKLKFLIIDEADRMFDMGFIRDVEQIINACPRNRQTLLFSATITHELDHLINKHMKNPAFIEVDNQVDPSKLYQVYYDVPYERKFSLIVHLLKQEKEGYVMVFCNTRRNVDKLARNLRNNSIHALAIHGGLSQNRRNDTMKSFHSKETLILVCTDIAARGIDVKEVSHVYNYDLPKVANDYIHRIGRTARAGKNGTAISFVSEGDHGLYREICRKSQSKIESLNLPIFDNITINRFTPEQGRNRYGRDYHKPHEFRRHGGGNARSFRDKNSDRDGNDRRNGRRGKRIFIHGKKGPRGIYSRKEGNYRKRRY